MVSSGHVSFTTTKFIKNLDFNYHLWCSVTFYKIDWLIILSITAIQQAVKENSSKLMDNASVNGRFPKFWSSETGIDIWFKNETTNFMTKFLILVSACEK